MEANQPTIGTIDMTVRMHTANPIVRPGEGSALGILRL